ncbi:protein IQ-DOMAIN 17 [Daucus carota subsp. sativus]|uniref:protein IQ-DOMAIN 17 n=1 Tax=Daucus carota subsp. sativus TaxID=79200 RepID=UPI0007B222AA|nr:PREDICTED: protein IQ-DOMAIN 14 [Daucus carota subsp. sativus]
MGKNNTSGGHSLLNVVKKAFGSPTKSTKSSRSEQHEQEADEKKRGKRMWIFSKPCIYETTIQHSESANSGTAATCYHSCSSNASSRKLAVNDVRPKADDLSHRRAIALAVATTAAAQAAIMTAQAAAEVVRFASSSEIARKYCNAAVVIQTAFRGYLARRALRALRGIVKLQALVRGHNVRKRAKMTLRCIESLVRVQTRVRDQRRRLSYEGSKESTFGVSISLREIHVANRKSQEKEEKNYGWSEYWEKMSRKSCDKKDPIKTVEIDTAQCYSYRVPGSVCSPMHRRDRNLSSPFPMTPSPCKTKRLQVHSASPRGLKEGRNSIMAQTPTLGSSYHRMFRHENGVSASVPSYMAATASANARIRSESAPRQRPLTPERENVSHVKKRLSFPSPKADVYGVMSDTELERRLSSPSSTRGMQFGTGRRSSTMLRKQPW